MSRRLGGAAQTGSRTYSVLSDLAAVARGEEPVGDLPINIESYRDRPIDDLIADLAALIEPELVTLDDNGSREAAAEAISEALVSVNGSDLMAPSPALIEECFILAMANSAFATFRQDNGKFIQQKAEGNVEAIAQMEADIRSVMVEAVREAVTGVNPGNGGLSRARIQEIAREAINETCRIFEVSDQ